MYGTAKWFVQLTILIERMFVFLVIIVVSLALNKVVDLVALAMEQKLFVLSYLLISLALVWLIIKIQTYIFAKQYFAQAIVLLVLMIISVRFVILCSFERLVMELVSVLIIR
jgi:hypothetical protein